MYLRAPELKGRGWLNTGGRELALADFRGRFLLLDFWTFCCINCLHVLDELRPLEDKYGDALVIVGVHSPKFAHEGEEAAVRAAVERYEVGHPVLDDPELVTWQNYTARAWPTLVLVDPNGYIVAQYSGEGHAHALDALLGELIAEHETKGTLTRGRSPYVAPEPEWSELRFPAKLVVLGNGNLLVADAGNHSLAELGPDAETLVRRIGSGQRGFADGATPSFSEPNGLTVLPSEIAAQVGYDVVVADTVNHALRGVSLESGVVTTLVGTGKQWMDGDSTDVLSSPWDVAWWQGKVWIAMAGVHQLWTFDPISKVTEVAAGTTNEGLKDGDPREAWFAQTSGLAADGDRLWLADSEISALRWVDTDVHTAVGTGLFDFGLRDGKASEALLQHPLGVTVLPDGSIAIADTYNGAVRRYDPRTETVDTMATDLAEPSGAVVVGNELLVVESAAHRITRIPLGASATASEFSTRTQRPPMEIAGGEVTLEVVFASPPGQKLDDRYGPSTRLLVSSTPEGLLKEGSGDSTELVRRLVIDERVGDGVLHVAVQAASCDDSDAVEFPACHMHRQDWGVPVRVTADGPARLELVLSGAATP
ncbi:redoxin domain-containing protein [Kribbella sandramycini]|uniref:Redoxin domain-containing protein n=1 Tax=Kribbella sandramycini TaxID=60450 RepID=A0A7Y4P0X3_9ACTN|nr:NHL domain-containing thioredoxin family protein [Kribbella sandramycini]MBB6565301.1 thiol-disulfide isomerase/thioredoxin [Kribbella sandramycini]NOL41570.1 redoxin domain-containing protein [Kribbella sandramycini]